MRLFFATAAVLAAATFSAPAQATECISDLIKARDYIQSAPLDRGTRRYAELLWGKAQVYKVDGKFELCDTTTRQLMHLLDLQ